MIKKFYLLFELKLFQKTKQKPPVMENALYPFFLQKFIFNKTTQSSHHSIQRKQIKL